MNDYARLCLCLILAATVIYRCNAQLLPILIGQDVYTPDLAFCVQEDIRTNSSYYTQCDYFRSDGCNVGNFRCTLASTISNVNTSAQLINFTVTTYAAMWSGINDGKVQINLRYTDGRPFQLLGVLQLWRQSAEHGNAYVYAQRVTEVTYVANISAQTYMFHGLSSGLYVATYWDNGGTRLGAGNPEFSQPIIIKKVFSTRVDLRVKAMPLDNYNTNYQRPNRNFISYQLVGPLSMRTVMDAACLDPTMNRCLFWEWRSDLGNIINAKTELETVPPDAASDGFVDSMYKFKIFPMMCCSTRTRITARLMYSGAFPLFPVTYADYWNQRQNFGSGTTLAYRVLQNERNYLDDNTPCSTPASCQHQLDYQAVVDANWGTPNQLYYPACVADSAVLNTIESPSATLDIFTVNTLRRNYCQCFFDGPTQCISSNIHSQIYQTMAWRSGLGQYSNNFDRYEDYYSIYDAQTTVSYQGDYVHGRVFAFDPDFAQHTNTNDAFDFSCNPFITYYATLAPQMGLSPFFVNNANNVAMNGLGLFADIVISANPGKKEIRDFFSYDSGVCNYGTPAFIDFCTFRGSVITDPDGDINDFFDLPYWSIVSGWAPGNNNYYGPMLNTQAACNCLSLVGDYAFAATFNSVRQGSMYDPGLYPFNSPYAFNYFEWVRVSDIEVRWQVNPDYGGINPYALGDRVFCCNVNRPAGTSIYGPSYVKYGFSIYTPTFGVAAGQSPMSVFAGTYWQANIQQVTRAVNWQAIKNVPANRYYYIQYSLFGQLNPNYIPAWPNALGNSTNPNICYSYYISNLNNPCLNYISLPAPNIIANSLNEINTLIANDFNRIYTFNKGTLLGTVGAQFTYSVLNQPTVFGVYGLDTFPVEFKNNVAFHITDTTPFGFSNLGLNDQTPYSFMNIQPTYARYQVIPTVDIYGFSEIIWGPSNTYTIDISFQVSCPGVNMNTADDNLPGRVGYCAPFFTILNQNQVPIVVSQVSGPSMAEPPPSSNLPYGIVSSQIIGGVLEYAEFTVRILYNPSNNGDSLYWYFFPKPEPEQPVGTDFCGSTSFSSYSGIMKANETVSVPDQSTRILPMICSLRAVPPACEYNQPQMLAACFRGQPFDYAVCPLQDLPSYETTGNPLDYGRCTNYWFDWVINGTKVYGMSTYAQPYNINTTLTVYDQSSVIPNLTPGIPANTSKNTNPLVRITGCDNTNATCFVPNDDTNATGVSVINQIHYCALDGVTNLVILQPSLVFVPPYSFNDQVGAMYCNETTEYISVQVQELQTKALFGIQLQCNVSKTAYYTYTIRYGKSISALALGVDFPCYERMIVYSIILTSFQASPGTLYRIPGCNRADNCCYQMPINVFGNTGNNEDIVNLDSCNTGPNALPECIYEIVVSPVTPASPNLCLGTTYTFTVRSPAALVQTREQPTTGVFFQYPWRCQSTFKITLPTLGFSPIGAVITNGDCRYEGSFMQLSYTYTNPVCVNAISVTNGNPQCRLNLWLAIEPTQVPCNCYNEPMARLSNPFLVTGANTASYNLQSIIDFPQILPSGEISSLPDGIYTVYMWLSTGTTSGSAYAPYSNFNSLAAGQPRNAISSQVTVQFDSANGLKIILNYINYPRCPAKFGDNLTLTSTAIGITIRDTAYNGPYNLTFYTPTNQLISNYVIGTKEACCSTCGSLSVENVFCNVTCPACDVYVQDRGLPHVFYLGTGIYSNGAGVGMYYITATTTVTHCTASYFPYIVPLNTLSVQVSCNAALCYNQQTSSVLSAVNGGTEIPLTQAELIQNADYTIATARYYYVWTGTLGPNTNLTLVYRNQTYLPYVYGGNFTLNVTDFNGCWEEASCAMVPRNAPLEIELVGVTNANCSNQQGAITIAVKNNTGVPPYTLYKVGPNQHPVMTTDGYILQDTSVTPNELFYYMVCDGNSCCSQMLNLSISAPAGVTVGLIINEYPCSTITPTGSLTAVVNPPNGAYSYVWYLNGNVYLGPTNVGTLRGLFNGLYQVVVTNTLTNCNNFAQIVLPTAANLVASYERQTNVEIGVIRGTISGGNGEPYRVSVSPDVLNATMIIIVEPQALFYSAFTIYQVVLSQSFRINFFDSKGCATSSNTEGVLTPVTDPPIITPSPSPHVAPEIIKSPGMWPVYVISAFFMSVVLLVLMIFVYETRYRRSF